MEYKLYLFVGSEPPEIYEHQEVDPLIVRAEKAMLRKEVRGFEIWSVRDARIVAEDIKKDLK